MLVKSTDTVLKLSGSPKPGEAIRAVLLGRSCLDSNINATIEFHWYKKESNQEQKEHHQKREQDVNPTRQNLSRGAHWSKLKFSREPNRQRSLNQRKVGI